MAENESNESIESILKRVGELEGELAKLTRHLKEVRQELETRRSPPESLSPPKDFSTSPHFGNMA